MDWGRTLQAFVANLLGTLPLYVLMFLTWRKDKRANNDKR